VLANRPVVATPSTSVYDRGWVRGTTRCGREQGKRQLLSMQRLFEAFAYY
jgi:hypothetical protein